MSVWVEFMVLRVWFFESMQSQIHKYSRLWSMWAVPKIELGVGVYDTHSMWTVSVWNSKHEGRSAVYSDLFFLGTHIVACVQPRTFNGLSAFTDLLLHNLIISSVLLGLQSFELSNLCEHNPQRSVQSRVQSTWNEKFNKWTTQAITLYT